MTPPTPLASPSPVPSEGTSTVARDAGRRDRFDWPQYGGGPGHAASSARTDEIHAPKVLWFVPGCAGQPTLVGEDLFTGGITVARLSAETGMVKADYEGWLLEAGLEEAQPPVNSGLGPGLLKELLERLEPNDPTKHAAVGSPVLGSRFVFVRNARDGSVLALNHALSEEFWRWESGWDPANTDSASTRVPLCLTEEDILLVPLHERLIALRAKDGRELWRYSVNGVIEMVPAADEGRVFLGTDKGLLVALSVSTGEELWRTGSEGFAPTAPVVARGRVLAITRPWTRPFGEDFLHAWEAVTGEQSWKYELFRGGRSSGLALGEKGEVVLFRAGYVDKVDLKSGKDDHRPWIEPGSDPVGAPAVIGEHLVFADEDGRVNVYDTEGEAALRWAFQLPDRARVQDFVHTGKRLYLATTIGLFCLGDDPEEGAVPPGFVLEWDGDPRLPSYLAEEK